MASNQNHVNPITVKRLLRISPSEMSRTSPRTPPILRLDEDSLRKIFDKYYEMVDKPKFIADRLLEVFKSNPNGTVSPNERKMARNILETTDIKTLDKIMLIIENVKPRNDNVVFSLKERVFDLASFDYYKERLKTLKIKVEKVEAPFNIAKLSMRIQRVNVDIESERTLETIFKTIKEILMKTTITEKYIQTLPYDAMVRQKIIEENINEKEKKIDELLVNAKTLIDLITKPSIKRK
jgi:hypothetical protein